MKHVASLIKKARARKEEGIFVVEGKKMFLEAPREWILRVYVSESFLKEPDSEKMISDISYETVADAVFRSISDTQTPQGILCLVKMPQYEISDLLDGNKTHLLLLESIQDPGNLGTMLRTGEGAGITGMILNHTTADLFNPKTIRSTMGSIYRVPFLVTEDLAKMVKGLKTQGIQVCAAHLRGTMEYDGADYTKPTAFLIGNEGNGLSNGIAELADTCVKIPMEGSVESLNAAVSAAILMYETNRQRRGKNG